jgi:GH43 family beta-xylosidase
LIRKARSVDWLLEGGARGQRPLPDPFIRVIANGFSFERAGTPDYRGMEIRAAKRIEEGASEEWQL